MSFFVRQSVSRFLLSSQQYIHPVPGFQILIKKLCDLNQACESALRYNY